MEKLDNKMYLFLKCCNLNISLEKKCVVEKKKLLKIVFLILLFRVNGYTFRGSNSQFHFYLPFIRGHLLKKRICSLRVNSVNFFF